MVAAVDSRESKRNRNRRRNSSSTWALTQELAVQQLYLAQGLSPKQIGDAMGLPPKRVSALLQRRGWTREKRIQVEKCEQLLRERTQAHVERVVQATAAVAEAASIGGLQRALDATQDRGEDAAKDFRAWAGGARDLVTVARQARGLVDPGKGDTASATNVSLSLFCVQASPSAPPRAAERQEKRVEPLSVEAKALPS